MRYTLESYLRTHRRKAGLSQSELARLIGADGPTVCRLERGHRRPNLKVALACEFVFQVSLQEIFPGISQEVETSLIERARELHRVVQRRRETPRQRRCLETVRTLGCVHSRDPADDT